MKFLMVISGLSLILLNIACNVPVSNQTPIRNETPANSRLSGPTTGPSPLASQSPVPFETTRAPTLEVQPPASVQLSPTPMPRNTPSPFPSPTRFITPPAAGSEVNIPILMYHNLKNLDANASQTQKTWTVAPSDFAEQLDYLAARGFHTITLAQLVAFFDTGTSLPEHPIILTFDDGWKDDYTVAFPELKKRGMVGVFFAPTSYIKAGGATFINWDDAKEMDTAGMEFGSHTVNHVDLKQITLEQGAQQLADSKAELEQKLGHAIVGLSYPFGSFNPAIVSEAIMAGYRAAVILCCGYKLRSDSMLTLPRIRISYGDTIEVLKKALPPE